MPHFALHLEKLEGVLYVEPNTESFRRLQAIVLTINNATGTVHGLYEALITEIHTYVNIDMARSFAREQIHQLILSSEETVIARNKPKMPIAIPASAKPLPQKTSVSRQNVPFFPSVQESALRQLPAIADHYSTSTSPKNISAQPLSRHTAVSFIENNDHVTPAMPVAASSAPMMAGLPVLHLSPDVRILDPKEEPTVSSVDPERVTIPSLGLELDIERSIAHMLFLAQERMEADSSFILDSQRLTNICWSIAGPRGLSKAAIEHAISLLHKHLHLPQTATGSSLVVPPVLVEQPIIRPMVIAPLPRAASLHTNPTSTIDLPDPVVEKSETSPLDDLSLLLDDEDLNDSFDDDADDSEEETDFAALGIDPTQPTDAPPGSEKKNLVFAARYRAGLPLNHPGDESQHGPKTV
jgi:hypothetical protein